MADIIMRSIYFGRRLYTDLTLVADGKYVRCHRVVLASASPYFHSRLYNGKRENTTDKLFITDVPQDILFDVLDFVYSGECRLNVENAEDLLRAAAIFELGALKDMCDYFLKDNVDAKNGLRLYKLARASKAHLVEEAARTVILNNFMHLWHTKLFKQLNHRELISIIQHDDLVTPSEDVVCGAVIAWVTADRKRRKYSLGEILRHVRLPQVRKEYLRQLVEEEEMVRDDPVSTQLINEALKVIESPTARHEVTTPAMEFRQETKLDDVLVVVGGIVPEESRFKSKQIVSAFNLSLRKWFPLAPMPYGCDSGVAHCVRGNDIYVAGGGDTRQGLVVYDSEHNSWRVLAPMVIGRRGHALLAMGQHLYVVGGVTESSGDQNSPRPSPRSTSVIERYDVKHNTWKVVGAVAEPVWGASAVVFKEKIHIFGGFHGKDKPTAIVQTFDPVSGTARITSQLPLPMALSRAAVSEGTVYLVGPSGNILTTNDCWRYHVVASIPDFRRALFGVAHYKQRLFIAGGKFGETVFDDILMVDLEHQTLVQLPEKLPGPVQLNIKASD
nr:hypothetical protein BaRGS_022288 [Batillaria attramentaria]